MITFLGRIVTLYIIILSITAGFLVNYALKYVLVKYGMDFILPYSNYISWSVFIVLYGSNLKRLWIYTPENHGQILVSGIPSIFGTKDIVDSDNIERPTKQRAVFEGWSGKWPWETAAKDSNPISLVKTTPLNISVEAQSADNLTIKAKFVGAMSAIPDANLVWHNRANESAAVDLYKARIHAEAQKLIREGLSAAIVVDPTKFFKPLNDLFGGKKINEEEQRTGRFVSSITVEFAVRDEGTQKLDEAKANASKVRDILDTIIPACGGNQILEQAVAIEVLGLGKAEIPTNINITDPGKGKKGKS